MYSIAKFGSFQYLGEGDVDFNNIIKNTNKRLKEFGYINNVVNKKLRSVGYNIYPIDGIKIKITKNKINKGLSQKIKIRNS